MKNILVAITLLVTLTLCTTMPPTGAHRITGVYLDGEVYYIELTPAMADKPKSARVRVFELQAYPHPLQLGDTVDLGRFQTFN